MRSSGFTDLPVTQTLIYGIVASSLSVTFTQLKHALYIQVFPHIWPPSINLFRLLGWQLAFTNTTEIIFATMTIMQMRVVERIWGSRKFATFIAAMYPLTSVTVPLLFALVFWPLFGWNYLPAGPTSLAFALLAQYHGTIPQTYQYHLQDATQHDSERSGLSFSNKTFTYVFATQLALSQLPGSAISAGVGWAMGCLWRYGGLSSLVLRKPDRNQSETNSDVINDETGTSSAIEGSRLRHGALRRPETPAR